MNFTRKKVVKGSVWFVAIGMILGGVARLPLEAQQATLPPEVVAYADTVLYNGKILTADEQFSIAEAVAIRDGKFLAVGTSARILPMAGSQTRRIDLKGRAVMPGLVDVHQHPFTEGMMAYWVAKNNVKWEGFTPDMHAMEREIWIAWTSMEVAVRDIARAAAAAKPGEVIVIPLEYARGMQKPGTEFCREITLAQIDAVSPQNPVIFIGYVNLWPQAANSYAARLLKVPEGAQVFDRPVYSCLTEEGKLAANEYWFWNLSWEEKLRAGRDASLRANRWGVTLAYEHTALPMLTIIRQLWAQKDLTVRLRMPFPLLPQTGQMYTVGGTAALMAMPPEKAESFFKQAGNMSGLGDDMWRFVGVAGAVGGNTQRGGAWTIEPKLRDIPGLEQPYGQSRERPGEIFAGREGMIQAIRYGWDVRSNHTVGDRAVAEVLKAFEEGLKNRVVVRSDQMLTINHTPMASPESIQKMQELGIRPSIGPWHIFWEPALKDTVFQYGTERVYGMVPMKSYIKLGIKPALEGDLFIDPPFWRMYIAITRKDESGKAWNPQEAVSRQEALWMSTLWGAWNFGEEDKLGSIEPGKLADLVVLDRDYMTIPEEEIRSINPLLTIVAGKVVYEMEGGLK